MNPINIVCATDEKYVPYCGVMITSAFENNKEREVNVYILIDKSLSIKSIRRFRLLEKKYQQKIYFCKVDGTFFEKYPIKGGELRKLSIVTYYRIYAPILLPNEVNLVLYLDCDVVVNGAIGELFDIDWSDTSVGVVPDMCTEWQEFYDRLEYKKAYGYFNAGVVLINLKYWRKHNVMQMCLDYLKNNYDKVDNNDQDVMNVVLKETKRQLHVTFNFQVQLLMPYFYNTFSEEMKNEIKDVKTPRIIHYAAELKPWMAYYYSYPFYSLWKKYKKLSPWFFMLEQLPEKRKIIAFVKRYIIWPFGLFLKKPQVIDKYKNE